MTGSMTRTKLAAGALALAVSMAPPAFAYGMRGGGGCEHGAWVGGGRMLHALDLTADQKDRAREILAAHRPKLRQLGASAKAAKEAIADKLLGGGDVTQADLDRLAQQATQARANLTRERLATALEVRGLLTPDQLQKSATIHAGMKQLHAQMHELLGRPSVD